VEIEGAASHVSCPRRSRAHGLGWDGAVRTCTCILLTRHVVEHLQALEIHGGNQPGSQYLGACALGLGRNFARDG